MKWNHNGGSRLQHWEANMKSSTKKVNMKTENPEHSSCVDTKVEPINLSWQSIWSENSNTNEQNPKLRGEENDNNNNKIKQKNARLGYIFGQSVQYFLQPGWKHNMKTTRDEENKYKEIKSKTN